MHHRSLKHKYSIKNQLTLQQSFSNNILKTTIYIITIQSVHIC